MPIGSDVDITDLDGLFCDFCSQVWQYKESIQHHTIQVDAAAIYQKLSSEVKEILDKQKSVSFEMKVREVVYIMVSVADEIFLNTDWNGKSYWEENMLEKHFFGTQIAGEKIFKNIENIVHNNNNAEWIIMAEIYMKALSLGFQGKFRGLLDCEKEINMYRKQLFNFVEKLDKSIDMVDHKMFSKEYSYTLPTLHRQFLPDASIINYVFAFFIFMFLVISSVVWFLETHALYESLHDISSIILRGNI